MNSSLRQTQRLFWRAMSHPTGVADFLAQADPETRALFQSTFAESANFSRSERVAVYADGYFYRLLDVLADAFPLLRWQLGPEQFHNLITDYVLEHPSSSPNLHDLGRRLPNFVASHAVSRQLPQLADLAQVELHIFRALDGPDSPILTQEKLAEIPPSKWADMRLTPIANLSVLESGWVFRDFREAQQQNRSVPQVERRTPPVTILVWRKEFTVFTRTLEPAEAELLAAVRNQSTFGEASAHAAKLGADAGQLVRYLTRWLSEQLLQGATVD